MAIQHGETASISLEEKPVVDVNSKPELLDPTIPTYSPDSPEERLVVKIARLSAIIGAIGLIGIGVSLWTNWYPKVIVSVLAGLCATVPPIWFSYEHFFLYRRKGVRGSFELFKQGQQVAFTVWAGFTTALVALAASDFVKEDAKEYKCEVVMSAAPTLVPAPFHLLCKTK